MNETFASDTQLFRAYEVVFQALLNGLIVAVAVLFLAAIVLIILCCRELRLADKRRDAELKAAYEACRKRSATEDAPTLDGHPPEIPSVRHDPAVSWAASETVSAQNATAEGLLPVCRKSRFPSFRLKSQNQRNAQ